MGDLPPVRLPKATSNGVLPEGIHDVTLAEIGDRFGGFQRSTRRIALFENLRRYLEGVRKAGWDVTVILNGSFIMECVDTPSDIDLVLVFPGGWDMSAELKPFEYNLVSKKRTHGEYRIHVFPVTAGSEDEQEWLTFFQRVSPKWTQKLGVPAEIKKGLIRIT